MERGWKGMDIGSQEVLVSIQLGQTANHTKDRDKAISKAAISAKYRSTYRPYSKRAMWMRQRWEALSRSWQLREAECEKI